MELSVMLMMVILVAYLLILKEIIEVRKILNKMIKRSKKYMKEVVSNDK